MVPKPRFIEGEKALCFQCPLLYEAKCLKSRIKNKEVEYLIHYNGWNKNFDEWVPESRVLKYNEKNLEKQKELAKTHVKTKAKSASKAPVKKDTEKEPVQTTASERLIQPKTEKKVSGESSSCLKTKKSASKALVKKGILKKPVQTIASEKPSVSSLSTEQNAENQPEPKKKKVRFEEPCVLEEAEEKVEIKLNFPDFLKDMLLDDWDLITHQKKILRLPARVTVDHIIAGFVKEKVSVKGISQFMENTIIQVANRIRDCFNVLLGNMLLYRFERPQYAEIYVEYHDRGMSQAYGAIHLLRMFTKLGELLSPIVETGNSSPLVGHLNDFVKYLSINRNFFNLDDYVVATPEYHRRALY